MIVLSTGREIDVLRDAIGITSDGQIATGYDQLIDDVTGNLTTEEAIELACLAIERWLDLIKEMRK